jgi:hypothetical protein
MNQSNREQVISSDLNRIGKLANREAQDADASRAVRPDFYNPASNAFDDFSASARSTNAVPISGLTKPPSLDGIASSFSMNLGAGEGELYVAGTPAADESTYQLLRWPAQTVSIGTPDPSNPKVCTIYATPADSLTDRQSRNILSDPSTRTMVPANVYKTSNPLATISVAVGTAAALPTPPAVPAGSLGLIDVYLPAASADSTAFIPTRRSQRLIEFPGSSQHGILKGCVPVWGYATDAAGDSAQMDASTAVNRLVIDGELLTFNRAGYGLSAAADTAHTPGSAPAGNDMPTYLYLCGGRNFPVSLALPVVMIESTVVPDALGYPTATLAWNGRTIPRAAALYVGVAFKVANSNRSKSLFYDGDWVYPQAHTPASGYPTSNGCATQGFYLPYVVAFTTWSPPTLSYPIPGIPATSTSLELQADAVVTAGGTTGTFIVNSNVGGPQILAFSVSLSGSQAQSSRARITVPTTLVGGVPAIECKATGDITAIVTFCLNIRPTAFNMNIPRIGR